MSLFAELAALESNDDLHLGRLLVLLGVFAGSKGNQTVDGLTKLAKLDFLLRYPVFLERALAERGVAASEVETAPHERQSVESKMVRYRYGPWDFRYRRFINILTAKGLAFAGVEGRTVKIGLTDAGVGAAKTLASTPQYGDMARRSRLLKRHVNMGATNLMRFVYDTFPEIVSLRLGEEITYERQD